MLRVIAGKYKRSTLNTLEGEDITRPTRDMVKEALFSSISLYEEDYFLDLFSGSGAIGIEAISRGCNNVYFNDLNKEAYKIIKGNLAKFKEDKIVYNLDYKDCLNKLKGIKFDYIYIDPPYKFNEYELIFEMVKQNELLNSKGIMIVEVKKDTDLNKEYCDIKLYKEKRYGINKLLYYKQGE